MKKRIAIVMAVLTLFLLGTVIGVMATEHGPTVRYAVMPGIAAGGRYQLAGLSWQVDAMVGGGHYRLLGIFAPSLAGSGCCCTYLPCVRR